MHDVAHAVQAEGLISNPKANVSPARRVLGKRLKLVTLPAEESVGLRTRITDCRQC